MGVEFENVFNKIHSLSNQLPVLDISNEKLTAKMYDNMRIGIAQIFLPPSKTLKNRKRHLERMTIEKLTAVKFHVFTGAVTDFGGIQPGSTGLHQIFTDRREVENIADLLNVRDEIAVFGCSTLEEFNEHRDTARSMTNLSRILSISYSPADDEVDLKMQQNMQENDAPFENIVEAARFFREKFRQVGVKIGKLDGRDLDEIIEEISSEMATEDVDETRSFATKVIDEVKKQEEAERLFAEKVKAEQEEISRRGENNQNNGLIVSPAKKSKNKKKRKEEKERQEKEQLEKVEKEILERKLEKRVSILDKKFSPVARVKQVFKSFTSNVLKCRQVNKVRSLLHKAGVLADCRKRGSHSILHGENQQSITFVRPHGPNAGVNAKALENNVVAALQGA